MGQLRREDHNTGRPEHEPWAGHNQWLTMGNGHSQDRGTGPTPQPWPGLCSGVLSGGKGLGKEVPNARRTKVGLRVACPGPQHRGGS